MSKREKIMQIRRLVMLSTGMMGIVVLLAAASAFAQSDRCISKAINKQGEETDGHFAVTVNQRVRDGRRIYLYSVSSLADHKANKLFIWVRQGLELEEGFIARRVDTGMEGDYVTPHETVGGFPPKAAWLVAHHEDGVVFTDIATDKLFEINVKERFQPEDSMTTVLLGTGPTFEHCGPLPGPKNPAAPAFEGSPVASKETHICFKNGCCYFATVEETTGVVTNLVGDPDTPKETVYPDGERPQACRADLGASCEGDLNIPFCGVGTIQLPPVQSKEGGTCYYPSNIKFPC